MKTKLLYAMVLASSMALVACGGSSSSSGGDGKSDNNNGGSPSNPTDPSTTDFKERDSLTTDANHEGYLFYTTSPEANSRTLWALNPNDVENPVAIQKDMKTPHSSAISPLPEASVVDGKLQGFHIARVIYVPVLADSTDPEHGRIVGVRTDLSENAEKKYISSYDDTDLASAMNEFDFTALFGWDFHNVGPSVGEGMVVFPNANSDQWQRLRISIGPSGGPDALFDINEDYRPIAGYRDALNDKPYKTGGWLVIEGFDDFVQSDLVDTTAIFGKNRVLLENIKAAQAVGPELLDGTRYLMVMKTDSSGASNDSGLWRFDSSLDISDRFQELKNSEGDSLEVGFNHTADRFELPPGLNQHVYANGAVYFTALADDGITTKLVRADENGWEYMDEALGDGCQTIGNLTATDDHLVWTLQCVSMPTSPDQMPTNKTHLMSMTLTSNEVAKIVDDGMALNMPTLGSRDNWIYYNEIKDGINKARAKQLGTNNQVSFDNASWVGASSSGNSLHGGLQFTKLAVSEMVMMRTDEHGNNAKLYALEAADLEAGALLLGELKPGTDDAMMAAGQPGPHHITKVVNGEEFELMYFNTRQKNSLQPLMDKPGNDSRIPTIIGEKVLGDYE